MRLGVSIGYGTAALEAESCDALVVLAGRFSPYGVPQDEIAAGFSSSCS